VSPIAPVLASLGAKIARLSAQLGEPVDVATLNITDREGLLPLDPPTTVSPNRACHLIAAADGWIALNLAREEDRELIPAWLGCEVEGDQWATIARLAGDRACAELIDGAALLGLPAGRVGEVVCDTLAAPLLRMAPVSALPPLFPAKAGIQAFSDDPALDDKTPGPPLSRRRAGVGLARSVDGRGLRVVDLSALWAGPMCGAVLAAMGASVVKIESPRRPDPTRTGTPVFFERLNGGKDLLGLDFGAPGDLARLQGEVAAADVLITSARPRAFAGLGLAPEAVFAANPSLTWVAITGYGWTGEGAHRVAFGDDAAAAGGLVSWTDGGPRFLGDALSDPVTGLAAAAGALEALSAGGGVLVDLAMARAAAGAASALGLAAA
jgi:hypothetical protein